MKKEYTIIARCSDNPNAPTYQEVMELGVKPWVEDILKYGEKLKLQSELKNDIMDIINM